MDGASELPMIETIDTLFKLLNDIRVFRNECAKRADKSLCGHTKFVFWA
jgi:hypothetical protein